MDVEQTKSQTGDVITVSSPIARVNPDSKMNSIPDLDMSLCNVMLNSLGVPHYVYFETSQNFRGNFHTPSHMPLTPSSDSMSTAYPLF